MAREPKKKRGPDADRLRIDKDDWEEAVKKALGKKKPDSGWPDEPKKKSE